MKDFLAAVLMIGLFLSFVFVAFGIWDGWTLWIILALGFVYMIFTEKVR